MSQDGPLLRLFQHELFINDEAAAVDLNVYASPDEAIVSIEVVMADKSTMYASTTDKTYGAAYDITIKSILDQMNDRYYGEYDITRAIHDKAESIRLDNPNINMRGS